MSSKELIRLSKLMSMRNICSRREADVYIEKGLVRVDDEIVSTLGTKVDPECRVELTAQAKEQNDNRVTFILNKPLGYLSSPSHGSGYALANELITSDRQDKNLSHHKLIAKNLKGLSPAGRLDINSKGLLILTQNGTLAKQIIGENSLIEKEYLVRVKGPLSDSNLRRLRYGLTLDGVKLKRATVEWINDNQLKFILTQGRKRQIRRMCELVNLDVVALKRVRIGNITLGTLKEGHWAVLGSDFTENVSNT